MASTVIFDADCGICQRTRTIAESLDWLRTMRWIALRDADAEQFGIPREQLEKSVYLVAPGGRRYHGFDAVKQVLLRLPATYAAAGLAIRRKPIAAIPLVLFFSPLFQPAGEWLYSLVAENRYRFPGATCRHLPGPAPMG